jgi:hypothetical protein
VQELDFCRTIAFQSSDNWERDFESIEKFNKVVAGKDELKRLKLDFSFEYVQRPSKGVCNRSLARWKQIKKELKSICVKEGIEIVDLTCALPDLDIPDEYIWQA